MISVPVDLLKEKKAVVDVTLAAHLTDKEFKDRPPLCRVTITIRDPADKEKKFEPEVQDITIGDKPPHQAHFVISVQSTVNGLAKRLSFGLIKSAEYVFDVVAEPMGGFEEIYKSYTLKDQRARPGEVKSITVILEPKNQPESSNKQSPPGGLKL